MNILGRCCLLAVIFVSVSALAFSEEVEVKKECPKGQVFDKDKGVCVDVIAVPAVEHEKVETPVSK